jgi:endonuclease/exonuclease/phosphatase family metal-dependent hydrolase
MKNKLKQYLFDIRNRLSRSKWAAGLLDLPCIPNGKLKPGLVMIQVDGLSCRQFQRALQHNRLTHIQRLVGSGTYALKSFYSGIPSTTPAVQAELFFGKKNSVPAFEFYDRKNAEKQVMFYPWSVKKIAERLQQSSEPLLQGGTSYSNIFAAGADEARYCVQTMKLESLLRSASPLRLLVVIILYFSKIIRIVAYALFELGLAVNDFFGGMAEKRNFFKELKFIPTRVFISVILRELIRFRVKLDIKKGVRIIHANLVGYDEQSHRRGPDSAFAHWTLKGIDDVVRDVHHSAVKSECRNYHLIVYSDHGQEKVRQYDQCFGKPAIESIRETLADAEESPFTKSQGASGANDRYRAVRSRRYFGKIHDQAGPKKQGRAFQDIEVTTMGPLGHIYFPASLPSEHREPTARLLVRKANIPLVLFVRKDRVYAVNAKGVVELMRHKEMVLGKNHPFLQQTAADLAETCRHPLAGDLVFSGWDPDQPPMSFNIENGAHGGPGKEETRGFILLPREVNQNEQSLRALDLRMLVRKLFAKHSDAPKTKPSASNGFSLKVMSYNIHSCINVRKEFRPNDIVKVIAAQAPDIVAMQEVDAHKPRSGFIDHPKFMAEQLYMQYEYFPLLVDGTEQFGLAILSRYPIEKVKYERLPAVDSHKHKEPRGAMWVKIMTPEHTINLINTHLGLSRNDRLIQIRTLMGNSWGLGVPQDEPLIFCGDLNAMAQSTVYREVAGWLADVQRVVSQPCYPKATFLSYYPILRIDHIFVSEHMIPTKVCVPDDRRARMASDHLPVSAELKFRDR